MTTVLLVAVFAFAGAYAFINGFHDVSNSVAAAIRTRALTPGVAVVLASVAGGPDGLAAYDRQRRPRSQQVAKASRAIGRFGQQLENPIAVAARNTVMRLTPSRVALRSMARYADWRPPPLP